MFRFYNFWFIIHYPNLNMISAICIILCIIKNIIYLKFNIIYVILIYF